MALGHRPALDGIRAVAIAGVLVGHANQQWLPGGHFGVSVFFVLSGFLITTLLVDEYDRFARISLRAFYRRRFARLAPALLLTLAVSALVAVLVGVTASLRGGLVPALLYVANFAAQRPGVRQPFEFAWSLSIEEQFYLVWPVVLVLLLRRPRRQMLTVAAGLTLVAIEWRFVMAGSQAHLYYGSDTRAAGLLIGCVAALWRPRVPGWMAAAGLAVIGFGYQSTQFVGASVTPMMLTVVEVAAAVLILAVVSDRTALFTRLLGARPVAHVGELAYGLYLWNILLRAVVSRDWQFNGGLTSPVAVVAWGVVTFTVAELSLQYLERPARRWLTEARSRVGVEAESVERHVDVAVRRRDLNGAVRLDFDHL